MKLFTKAQLMAMKFKTRAVEIMENPKGMAMLELIGIISVILIILTVLIAFGGQIKGFLNRAGGVVSNLAVK